MADDTCYELDCCPQGISVTPVGGVLALAGDDSTGTDPNIADGQLLLLQEGYQTQASTTSGSPNVTVASYTGTPITVGQDVVVVGIYKTITATVGSPAITVGSATGLANNLYTISNFFPTNAYIVSIVGTTVTMSHNALESTAGALVLFYGSSSILPATIIPVSTTVANVSGTTITLSANATTTVSGLLLDFSPTTIDPNLVDGEEIYT